MTAAAPYRALTLAIHPSSRGFGWAAFSGPFSPYDWGIVGARGRDKNGTCLRRIERLFDRLTPETVVLEAFERCTSSRRDRIANLGRAIVALAVSKGIDVAIYSFADVRRCFAHVGARTRQEIAEAIGRTISAFEGLVPRKRRAWEPESRGMVVFNATALTLTCYQLIARAGVIHCL